MYVFINKINRTDNIYRNSIVINDDLQERVNECIFNCSGFTPESYQEIKVYSGFPIISSTANSITLNKSYCEAVSNNVFRPGSSVYVALNETDEEKGVVSTVSDNAGNIKLTFVDNFTNIPVAGELAGIKVFAGNITEISDNNVGTLKNLEYSILCLDYQKVFDKKLINDTFEDRDGRYIINDFLNTDINKNQLIDDFEYENATAIRSVWIESVDGNDPGIDSSDFREGNISGVFPWTNSSGVANFSKNDLNINISSFTGINSGTPTKGIIGIWLKSADFASITSVEIRIGSDSSNYVSDNISLDDNKWRFFDIKLSLASITGTPDWTATDYFEVIITQTGSGELNIDGARVLEDEFFRHYPYVEETAVFDDFRVKRTKPTETMQRIADELAWYWYIDYDRNVRLFPQETNSAPIDISETSNNFNGLKVKYDSNRLANRVVVEGGNETSVDKYSEVREGDGIVREWLMKNKFKNLVVKIDKNTVTDTMEGGTTTTTVNATAHGLVVDDYIVNRSRSNAVRKVLTVPGPNSFTVDAVTSQASGDTFSTFVDSTVGIEGIGDETLYDYMSNFNEKSIRNSETSDTLNSSEFIHFSYNEVFPILVQRVDTASTNNMVSVLGHTDGIFDGQKIIDKTVQSRSEAIAIATSFLNKYSNLVITVNFTTHQEGLISGQLINIKDTDNGTRNINQNFLIQKVKLREVEWGERVYTVTCSSLLFGMMELLSQILRQNRKLDVAEDEIINNIISANEILKMSDVFTLNKNLNTFSEILSMSDSITATKVTPPYEWGPAGTPQMYWDLAQWS